MISVIEHYIANSVQRHWKKNWRKKKNLGTKVAIFRVDTIYTVRDDIVINWSSLLVRQEFPLVGVSTSAEPLWVSRWLMDGQNQWRTTHKETPCWKWGYIRKHESAKFNGKSLFMGQKVRYSRNRDSEIRRDRGSKIGGIKMSLTQRVLFRGFTVNTGIR